MLSELQERIGTGKLYWNEPMKNHTTFRTGGCARCMAEPETAEQLRDVIDFCRAEKIPYYIVGNGSNLLVSDQGYDGVIIHLFQNMARAQVQEDRLILQAGVLMARAARLAQENGLSGMEFASGIPGTVGGAVVMNAGAYGGEMKDLAAKVTVLALDGSVRSYTGEEMEFGYRKSRVADEESVVLEAELRLTPGDPMEIRAKMEELRARRMAKQPLEYASAGSTFKRPEGYFAGKLIQEAGLGGLSVGDAQVSEKHCGFIINRGEASAAQILKLIGEVRRRVYENSGVLLEPEVKFLGNF